MGGPGGPQLLELFTLAKVLGKTVAEISEISLAELAGWREFFKADKKKWLSEKKQQLYYKVI